MERKEVKTGRGRQRKKSLEAKNLERHHYMYCGECAPDNPAALIAVQSHGEVKPKQTRAKTRAMAPEDFEQSVLYRTTDNQEAWMFDRQQFLEIANQYGHFTIDMCSDND